MDEFLTVAEIAETLQLNPQTIRNWIDAGKLPAYRLGPAGRRVRVSRADFERFTSARQVKPLPGAPPNFWEGEALSHDLPDLPAPTD